MWSETMNEMASNLVNSASLAPPWRATPNFDVETSKNNAEDADADAPARNVNAETILKQLPSFNTAIQAQAPNVNMAVDAPMLIGTSIADDGDIMELIRILQRGFYCHIHDEDKPDRLRRRRDDLQKYKIFGPLLLDVSTHISSVGGVFNKRLRRVLERLARDEADLLDFYQDLCVTKPPFDTGELFNRAVTLAAGVLSSMAKSELGQALLQRCRLSSEFPVLAALDLKGDDPRVCAVDIKILDVDLPPLTKALKKQPGIVIVDLRYNRITDEGALVLADFIKTSKTLRELNLMGNDIEEKGGSAIAVSLFNNENLIRLRLNGNPIGNAGGNAFSVALETNRRLISLDLGDTGQKTESMIFIAAALRENHSLKAINVNNPRLFSLQEETNIHFAKMLRINDTLTEIHLQKNRMKCFGADWIADNLRTNSTLKLLDLSCNRIGDDGCHSLSLHLLQHNTPLEILDLSVNVITNDGAFHLANALLKNDRLKMLSVAHNLISRSGFASFIAALKKNKRLQAFHVWGNRIDPESAAGLKELIECERLDPEYLDFRPYEVDGVVYIGRVSAGVNVDYYWTPLYGDRSPQLRRTRTLEGGFLFRKKKIDKPLNINREEKGEKEEEEKKGEKGLEWEEAKEEKEEEGERAM